VDYLKLKHLTKNGISNFEAANEAFIIPSDVQFVIAGNNLKSIQSDWKFNGCLHILRQIINTDYLWNQIRVQGGAYGASMSLDRQSNLILSSYRDPECAKTYEVYAGLGKYLEDLELSEAELTSYIIGAFSSLDQPLSFSCSKPQSKSII